MFNEYQKQGTEKVEKKSFFKRWCVLLILFILISYFVTIGFRILTPPPTIPNNSLIASNTNKTKTDFVSAKFVGEEPAFPKLVSIGKGSATLLSKANVEKKLTSEYILDLAEGSDHIWLSSVYGLTFDSQNNVFTLSRNQFEPFYDKKFASAEQAISTTTAKLKQLFPEIDVVVQKTAVKYGDARAQLEFTSSSDTKNLIVVAVPYSYQIGNYPLYVGQNYEYPVMLSMDASGNIIKLNITVPMYKIEITQEVDRIPVSVAIDNIVKDKAAIITRTANSIQTPTVETLSNLIFTSVQLEYRVDQQTSNIYPYYRFGGTAKSPEDITVQLEVITPAVSIEIE